MISPANSAVRGGCLDQSCDVRSSPSYGGMVRGRRLSLHQASNVGDHRLQPGGGGR